MNTPSLILENKLPLVAVMVVGGIHDMTFRQIRQNVAENNYVCMKIKNGNKRHARLEYVARYDGTHTHQKHKKSGTLDIQIKFEVKRRKEQLSTI